MSVMKLLAPHDRPREKLDRLGAVGLGGNELLAIIVGHGHHQMSALDVANLVLETAAGVHGLTRLTRDELGCINGVGKAKAAQILAAVELGRRTLSQSPGVRVQLGCPRDVAAYLMPQRRQAPTRTARIKRGSIGGHRRGHRNH